MSHHDPSLTLNTLVLAKTYGVYFVVVGLALIFSPERFRKWYEDILQEPRRVLFGGTISLIIGSYILAVHNHFVSDWPIVLTAIGYWGVISGAGCLISGKFISLFKPMIDSKDIVYRGSGLAWFLLGCFLAYKGYLS